MKKKSLSAKKKIHNKLLIHLKNPKVSKIYKDFDNFIKSNLNKFSFSVAVSGGADSLSLVYLSKCYSILNNVTVKFYHVDHKLRKESSKEAKQLNFLLKKFDINPPTTPYAAAIKIKTQGLKTTRRILEKNNVVFTKTKYGLQVSAAEAACANIIFTE